VEKDWLEQRLARFVREESPLGVAGAVVNHGETVWVSAKGVTNSRRTHSVTVDTQFRIGSITKTLIAIQLLVLRDAGVLDLDTPVNRLTQLDLPDFVTARSILSHTSGMRREPRGNPRGEVWASLEFPDSEELLDDIQRHGVIFPRQGTWHYSNVAYCILGEVIKAISGEEWWINMRRVLLGPLGMDRTTVTAESPFSNGYFLNPYESLYYEEPVIDLNGLRVAGQLWSSIRDLARWLAFLTCPDESILARRSLEDMTAPQVMTDLTSWTSGWGLGFSLARVADRVFFGHGGAVPGFTAAILVDRQANVGAGVMCNMTSGVNINGLLTSMLTEAPRYLPQVDSTDAVRAIEPPPESVLDVLGRWWSEGVEYIFEWSEKGLTCRAAVDSPLKQPAVFAETDADLWVTLQGKDMGEFLRLSRSSNGKAQYLYWAGYIFKRQPGPFQKDVVDDLAVRN